jgi:hypothetical protein
MTAKPGPSPSPAPLHLNLHHLHVSGGQVVAVVVLLLLALLAGSAARHRGRRSQEEAGGGSGWGTLSSGQDVGVLLVCLILLGFLAYALPYDTALGLMVLIGIAAVAFTVLKIFGVGPLIQKHHRSVGKDGEETWRKVY